MLNFPRRHIYTRNWTKSPETSKSSAHPRCNYGKISDEVIGLMCWRNMTVSSQQQQSPLTSTAFRWTSLFSAGFWCFWQKLQNQLQKKHGRQRCLNDNNSSEDHSWPPGGPQQQLQNLVGTKPEDQVFQDWRSGLLGQKIRSSRPE